MRYFPSTEIESMVLRSSNAKEDQIELVQSYEYASEETNEATT